MHQFFRTERYMQLVELTLADDLVGQRQLVESAIAQTESEERAFWLMVRAGGMISLPAPPVSAIMADVRTALAVAPEDPGTEEAVLLNLLALVVRAEQWEEGGRWVAMLPRVLRRSADPCLLWLNIGTLQWRRGRSRAAVRIYTRALDGMYQWGAERRIANQARYYSAHCYRALTAVEAGLTELAERDLEAAERRLPAAKMAEDILLGLAQSAVALATGDTALARRRLQWIWAQDQAGKYLRTAHPIRAEVEVQAARIALHEGNRSAFTHFSDRALAIAREHQLALTTHRVTAIRTRALGAAAAAEI